MSISGLIKVGQWFVNESVSYPDRIFVLSYIGSPETVILSSIETGGHLIGPKQVKNSANITYKEMGAITSDFSFRRYRPSDAHLLTDKLNEGETMNKPGLKYKVGDVVELRPWEEIEGKKFNGYTPIGSQLKNCYKPGAKVTIIELYNQNRYNAQWQDGSGKITPIDWLTDGMIKGLCWLTPEEVKEQSQISDEAALECSILHWQQVYDAPVEEIKNHSFDWTKECALCQRYNDCDACLLAKTGGCSENTPYRHASKQALCIQINNTTDKDKIKAMLDLLISLRKDVKMSEFKVGDKVRITNNTSMFYRDGGRVAVSCLPVEEGVIIAHCHQAVYCIDSTQKSDFVVKCGEHEVYTATKDIELINPPEKTVTLEVPESKLKEVQGIIDKALRK